MNLKAVAGGILLSFIMTINSLPTYAQNTTTPQNNTSTVLPMLDNTAYVLIDYDTGTILAQKNAQTPLPPASLTKMMTSYIIEQRLLSGKLKEDDAVKMSESAWCHGSGSESCMYVPLGKTASVIDMLKGIIIQSGNDASKAMAEHIAGNENDFAALMNAEAQKIGMVNTHFVNATGMPAEGHQASALDLAKLAQAIIKNSKQYYDIYSDKEFTYNNIKQENRNALLFSDPTVDGLKTGHTEQAGFCLVASSNRDGMRLIAVVMGSKSMKSRAEETRKLLDFGFGNYEVATLAPKGHKVGNAAVSFGKSNNVDVVAVDTLRLLTAKAQKSTATTILKLNPDIRAPITKGQQIGQLLAVIDGKTVASVPVAANSDVAQSNLFVRIFEHIGKWIKNLF